MEILRIVGSSVYMYPRLLLLIFNFNSPDRFPSKPSKIHSKFKKKGKRRYIFDTGQVVFKKEFPRRKRRRLRCWAAHAKVKHRQGERRGGDDRLADGGEKEGRSGWGKGDANDEEGRIGGRWRGRGGSDWRWSGGRQARPRDEFTFCRTLIRGQLYRAGVCLHTMNRAFSIDVASRLTPICCAFCSLLGAFRPGRWINTGLKGHAHHAASLPFNLGLVDVLFIPPLSPLLSNFVLFRRSSENLLAIVPIRLEEYCTERYVLWVN